MLCPILAALVSTEAISGLRPAVPSCARLWAKAALPFHHRLVGRPYLGCWAGLCGSDSISLLRGRMVFDAPYVLVLHVVDMPR